MMYEVALCDDDSEFLNIEENIINNYFIKKNIAGKVYRFHSGRELIKNIKNMNELKLILLDIDMNDMDGLSCAEIIRRNSNIPIAFVTGYIRYAPEGYKVNAIRYIIKDFQTFEASLTECLIYVYNLISKEESGFSLNCRERFIKTEYKNLIYIESKLHYCYIKIHENDSNYIFSVKKKLNELLLDLNHDKLLQVHKSFAVNIDLIEDIQRYYVLLSGNEKIPIAQTRFNDVKKKYAEHLGRW